MVTPVANRLIQIPQSTQLNNYPGVSQGDNRLCLKPRGLL